VERYSTMWKRLLNQIPLRLFDAYIIHKGVKDASTSKTSLAANEYTCISQITTVAMKSV